MIIPLTWIILATVIMWRPLGILNYFKNWIIRDLGGLLTRSWRSCSWCDQHRHTAGSTSRDCCINRAVIAANDLWVDPLTYIKGPQVKIPASQLRDIIWFNLRLTHWGNTRLITFLHSSWVQFFRFYFSHSGLCRFTHFLLALK